MTTEAHSIDEVLRINTAFFIPPFQRAYAWGGNEINRYFSDIIRLIESELDPNQKDKLEHFFGTLVIKAETSGLKSTKYIIVDGQQRLTTSLLFLIALRDSSDSQAEKRFITDNYLKNESSVFPEKIKLKQVTKDWDAYRSLIKGEEAQPGIIKNAYDRFRMLIEEKKTSNSGIVFTDYVEAIKRMNVAVILLDGNPSKGEDPQIIFETLNSLGKPLTLSDLIRNYVLLNMNSEDQTIVYERIWYPKIEEQLKDNASDFFRDFLQYKTSSSVKAVSDSNTKEIYAAFKDFVERKESYRNHKEFIDDIVQYVILYKWITQVGVPEEISSNKSNDGEIKELLRNIFHDIKSEAFKPFVMGLLYYHHYKDEKIKKTLSDESLISVLKTIRTYLIRRRLLNLTQGENKSIVLLCEKIPDLIQSVTDMPYLLSNLYYKMRFPNDEEVSKTLEEANFYEDFKNYRKFILGKIEEHNAKVAVDFRNSDITIEHIMPQKLRPEWEKSLGESFEKIHEKYLHNIGNLILTDFNFEMGNAAFENKKKELYKSNLFYRLEIVSNDNWGEEEIKAHQKNMIQWFLETFPLPVQYRNKANWNTKVLDVTTFSPLDDDAGDIAGGESRNKPSKLRIGDKEIRLSIWKDVYLKFMDFVKNTYDLQFVIDNQAELLYREDAIIPWSIFEKMVEEDDKMRTKYCTIDGLTKDKVVNLNPETLFFHVNIDTQKCMKRIANVMNKFCIPADYVSITLK